MHPRFAFVLLGLNCLGYRCYAVVWVCDLLVIHRFLLFCVIVAVLWVVCGVYTLQCCYLFGLVSLLLLWGFVVFRSRNFVLMVCATCMLVILGFHIVVCLRWLAIGYLVYKFVVGLSYFVFCTNMTDFMCKLCLFAYGVV